MTDEINLNVYDARDKCRTPFQWNSKAHAGFTSGNNPWLPVQSDYETVNLELQKDDPKSHYTLYKKLTTLRKDLTMIHGDFKIRAINKNVFTYQRYLKEHDTFIVIINMGSDSQVIDLNVAFADLPSNAIAEIVTPNAKILEG